MKPEIQTGDEQPVSRDCPVCKSVRVEACFNPDIVSGGIAVRMKCKDCGDQFNTVLDIDGECDEAFRYWHNYRADNLSQPVETKRRRQFLKKDI